MQLEKMNSHRKLYKNCSIHGNNREMSGSWGSAAPVTAPHQMATPLNMTTIFIMTAKCEKVLLINSIPGITEATRNTLSSEAEPLKVFC